jgi:hypothetical protein
MTRTRLRHWSRTRSECTEKEFGTREVCQKNLRRKEEEHVDTLCDGNGRGQTVVTKGRSNVNRVSDRGSSFYVTIPLDRWEEGTILSESHQRHSR